MHPPNSPETDDRLSALPGYLVRRAQQVHTALWSQHLLGELTGPQYAVLIALTHEPGLDQTRLGELASLDKNTAGDIVRRLVSQGWVDRKSDPADGRRRVLRLTAVAQMALRFVTPAAALVQEDLMRPVPTSERADTIDDFAAIAFARGFLPPEQPERNPPVLSMTRSPGYLIRRIQQAHSALWAELVGCAITEPQYAVLTVLGRHPGLDQVSAGRLASLDRSSAADVVGRLANAGLLQRDPHAHDARRTSLRLSRAASHLLTRVSPLVEQVQAQLLHPVPVDRFGAVTLNLARIAFQGDVPAGRTSLTARANEITI